MTDSRILDAAIIVAKEMCKQINGELHRYAADTEDSLQLHEISTALTLAAQRYQRLAQLIALRDTMFPKETKHD